MLRLLAAEDATVPAAVAAALPELTRAVDLLVAALRAGGRVHVVGAGTSGRLAALDADELGPTYGLEPGRWTAHVAAFDGTVDGEDDTAAGTEVGRLGRARRRAGGRHRQRPDPVRGRRAAHRRRPRRGHRPAQWKPRAPQRGPKWTSTWPSTPDRRRSPGRPG